ncbi:MAG: HAD-IIA family hydrolase [Acidimicrobiia bacterium]|nr:HAD-IIA family hydrolase [Acidimicrobiia bacterium]MYB25159.1 HAD-IIA family hydrolase [Acidimicrobiia bacterium]MYJ13301.1 HAD-IIA family hydrolase [Acidimicrobiia bacterium]
MSAARNVVIDLDGVMWVGERPVPGAAEAANRLAAAGWRVVYVTNMSRLTVGAQQERLARCGVRPLTEVVTSATAAASLLAPGDRVMVCGGAGIVEAVESTGAVVACFAGDRSGSQPTADGDRTGERFDAVVVGMDPSFDYKACGRAMRAVRAGARLIGTNHDPTYPTPDGLEAGGGAILAAVATAAETEPTLAGKPNEATVSCVRRRLGVGPGVVVGDRPDSDGLLAEALGFDFALVLSGVTGRADLPVQPEPAIVAADLPCVVDALLTEPVG